MIGSSKGYGLMDACRIGAAVYLLTAVGISGTGQGPYQEQGGLVVVEMESLAPGGQWAEESSEPGYTGNSYLRWSGQQPQERPGQGVFGVNVEIHQAGLYNFNIRNKHVTLRPRAQDVFVRLDGGAWISTFAPGGANWPWETRFGSAASSVKASFQLTPGVHRLEFSGRSAGFLLDRIHLSTPGHPGAEDAGAPESDNTYVNHRPQAKLTISPGHIPAGDNNSTVITLDASGTVDMNTWQELSYRWAVRGATYVEGTSSTDIVARITIPGDRAWPVKLSVSDNGEPIRFDQDHGAINVSGELGTFSGALVKWHTLSLRFQGTQMSEGDNSPNPFLDRRLTVTFRGPDGSLFKVPGFFNGNGQGSGTGRVWQVNFAPNSPGAWSYNASFRRGPDVAVSLDPLAGAGTEFDGASGEFRVLGRDPLAPGFLSKGLLQHVDEHYMKHADGGYFIKGGTDSPENLFGFKGFDDVTDAGGIGILHEYAPHVDDWEFGDPEFSSNSSGISGRGLIGALNYLSSAHVNSVYFLPMNLGGDGQDTHPFVGNANTGYNKRHYDISRLAQWSAVMQHAQEKGILLHFVLGETEAGNQNWLDNGTFGVERKLFYRELIARFGSALALKWNISEENNFSIQKLEEFAGYIQALDPYDHGIAVHTHPNNFQDYYALLGNPLFSSTSIQYDPNLANTHVEDWRALSAGSGHKWILDMDENSPASTGLMDNNTDDLRKRVLYDVYFSGGQVEWYFGYHALPLGGDLRCEDFRTRGEMWEDMWHARELMQTHLPFWEMKPMDGLLAGESNDFGGGEVFTKLGEVYAVYLPNASQGGILDLSHASGSLGARWFNPRTGVFLPGTQVVAGGGNVSFSAPPLEPFQDWVLLVQAE